MEKSFKIQTFNAGLFAFLTKDIVPFVDERLPLISHELNQLQADVICLQEVFTQKQFNYLKEKLPQYSHHIKARANNIYMSPGLCVFSKHPILEHQFTRFAHQQDIEKFSNHGFQRVTIDVNGSKVNILNIHMTAGGLTGNLETKRSAKIALRQAEQILSMHNVNEYILLGDLNCGPRTDTETYSKFLDVNTHGFIDPISQLPLEENITWDNQNALVSRQNFDLPTDRIDHILIHKDSRHKSMTHRVNLNKTFPNAPYNLSDHYGLLMEFSIN